MICAIKSRAASRSTLVATLRSSPPLMSSTGRPTNCATSTAGSAHRTITAPLTRSEMGSRVAGIMKRVTMSNGTSTDEVSTKYAAAGRDTSGLRQRCRPGPSVSPTAKAGHSTTTSSAAHAISMSSPNVPSDQPCTKWSDADAFRAIASAMPGHCT
jgi:hypothetical protein